MKKDLVTLLDLSDKTVQNILELTHKIQSNREGYRDSLKGKTIGLVFQKPSNRTRVSFEVGVTQLGGHAIYLGPDEIKLGKRESAKDVAEVLSRYLDGIVARTFSHADIVEMAKNASIPVINGLSDLYHPCQALADIYTIMKKKGDAKVKIAYVGDGNNVLHSLLVGASVFGYDVSYATPEGFDPNFEIVKKAKVIAKRTSSAIAGMRDPIEAVNDADVIYTDVWTSMGQEDEKEKRAKIFQPYQVNSALTVHAKKDHIFMHCLPAYRGYEVTEDVIDGDKSVVYDQAENRMHVQKSVLYLSLTD